MKKRILSIFLAAIMVVSLLPTAAWAATDSVLNITLSDGLLAESIKLGETPGSYPVNGADLSSYSDNAVSDFDHTSGGDFFLMNCRMDTSGSTTNGYPDGNGKYWLGMDGSTQYTAGNTYGIMVLILDDYLNRKPDKLCVNGISYNTQEWGGYYYCVLNLGTLDSEGNLSGGDFEEAPAHTHGEGDDAITFDEAITTLANLQNLFANGGSGYLANDIAATATLTIAEGKNVTLCLNGHVIEMTGSGSVISIPSGATLNLYDCGTTEHAGYDDANGLWHLGTGGEGTTAKTVTGGVITGGNINGNGGGVLNNGTFTLKSGTITGNKTTGNNRDAGNGGGLYDASTAVTNMEGGVISGTFTMSSGEISGNIGNWGGGLEVNSGSTVKVIGGKIINNKSNGGGAGINADGALTIADVTITGNRAANECGGVRIQANGTVIGGNTVIRDNYGNATGNNYSGGTAQNLHLKSGTTVTLGNGSNGANAPTTGMTVGVTLANGTGAFTGTAAATDLQWFTSDNAAYLKQHVTDHLELATSWMALQNALNAAQRCATSRNVALQGAQLPESAVAVPDELSEGRQTGAFQ